MLQTRTRNTRALSVEDTVLLDVTEHRVEAGDVYMMCSDGLSDMVRDIGIAEVMLASTSLEQKAKQLIAAANAKGGRDNISVVLIDVKEAGVKRGLLSRILGK